MFPPVRKSIVPPARYSLGPGCVLCARKLRTKGPLFDRQTGTNPIIARRHLGRELGIYLMDSQGVVAMPPNQEFEPNPSAYLPLESEELRLGFSHLSLRLLSRKDRITLRLAENIVPIEISINNSNVYNS